ncbi:hypothetical protein [Mycolicibacter minnesotensis]|uniref:hypothetical protein n=1 Tax=Mycolicibacter minnesotensis TaxID=1118379 RepID=UPI0013D1232A|nr:hypothetical protein [Mycolicibacter minnesotensis]
MSTRHEPVRTARHAFVDTVEGLSGAQFDHGTTLCSAWVVATFPMSRSVEIGHAHR